MKKYNYSISAYSITSVLVIIIIIAFLIGNNFIVEWIMSVNIAIKNLRNEFFPSFSTDIDDYLQFVPALLLLGLKFSGYKGDMDNKRFALFFLIATAVTQIIIYALKLYISELRPDGSDTLSAPSGHTATAFMIATMLYLQYNKRSFWYTIFGYSCATAVGLMRVLNNRHWIFDVIVGASLGIIITYWAYRKTERILRDRASDKNK